MHTRPIFAGPVTNDYLICSMNYLVRVTNHLVCAMQPTIQLYLCISMDNPEVWGTCSPASKWPLLNRFTDGFNGA